MSANPFEDEVKSDTGAGMGVDLAAFDEEFESAEAPEFAELPDGKYQVRIERAAVTKSQAGVPMIRWELAVISGQHQGRKLFKNSVITESSLPYVKGDLRKVGLELKKLSELPGRIGEALDKTLEVMKKTRGEYVNIYFTRLLTVPSGQPDMGPNPWG